MRRYLTLKEVPYFFGLLMGLLVYLINQNLSSYRNSPSLVYTFEINGEDIIEGNVDRRLVCHLENTSSHNLIGRIEVIMMYPTESQIPEQDIVGMVKDPKIVPVAPSDLTSDYKTYNVGLLSNSYTLTNIQPNSKYELHARLLHHPSMKEMPKLYITSNHPVRLVGGIEAWVVSALPKLEWCLIGMLIFVIPVYLIQIVSKK